jgi:hypothetical protein
VAGWVNVLNLHGRGIYTYEPFSIEARNETSISGIGERPLQVDLDMVTETNYARAYGLYVKDQVSSSKERVESVRFLANTNSDLANAALNAEPNVKFKLYEKQTGLDVHLLVSRIKFEQIGPALWVEITAIPAPSTDDIFIWDQEGRGWDDGKWIF